MKPLLLSLLIIIPAFSNAQKLKYPPASSSVYTSYQGNEQANVKSTLWSDDLSLPTNWSFTNTSAPMLDWSIQTDSSYISTSGPFQSPSATNGFLVFRSDTASGAMADAYAEYVGAPIDLIGFPNVRIQFEQQFTADSNERTLEVSQDGISWSSFVISDGSLPTGAKHDDLMSIDISSVAGNASNLYMRFHFSGTQEGYWAIDDIQLRSIDSVDLRAVSLDWGTTIEWGVRMPYYSIPPIQACPIEFCLVAANDGLVDQDTVMYSVSVPTQGFNSMDTFSIQSGYTDTLCPQVVLVPSSSTSIHQVDCQLQSNSSEPNILNNSIQSTQFQVLDGLWIKYARDDLFSGVQGGINGSGLYEYEVGNVFDFINDDYCQFMEVQIHPEAPVGAEIEGVIYVYDSSNGFTLIDQTFNYTITPADLGQEILLYLGNGTYFEAQKSYLVAVRTYWYDHSDSSEVIIATSGKSKPNTSFLRYASSPTTFESYYLTETPMVRLIFYPEGLEENQFDFNFSIHPNPANKVTTVSLDLPSNSLVNFSIVDISGKKIEQTESILYHEGKNQYELNTSELLNGVYFMTFTSDFGSTTKRIVVQH